MMACMHRVGGERGVGYEGEARSRRERGGVGGRGADKRERGGLGERGAG